MWFLIALMRQAQVLQLSEEQGTYSQVLLEHNISTDQLLTFCLMFSLPVVHGSAGDRHAASPQHGGQQAGELAHPQHNGFSGGRLLCGRAPGSCGNPGSSLLPAGDRGARYRSPMDMVAQSTTLSQLISVPRCKSC